MTARASVDILAVWPQVIERVRTQGGEQANEQAVRLWLGNAKVRPVGCEGGVLLVECPTALFQEQIRARFADALAAAAALLGAPVREVRCRVTGAALREHERQLGQAPAPAALAQQAGRGFKLLQDFVVGSCNRLAYDAVVRIVDDPVGATTPLFIHGASGLGKTHLTQGLALAFRERHPHGKVQYLPCERFTNDFIDACVKGNEGLRAFRVRMRHPDLLLIDDLHWLGKGQKERTKEELFATLNALTEQGKHVVITSDASPRDIQYLEDRFLQRFAGGLVVPLAKPDPATRREVLRAKARGRDLALPDEVVEYVAEHITASIRELEGAVNKLAAWAHSFQRRVDLSAARQALADSIGRGARETPEAMVLREVAGHYRLQPSDLTGRNRAGERSLARHVAMYVLKSASSETYAQVGRRFGVNSHSSVAYACEQVAQYRAQDAALDAFIGDLLLRVRRP